MPLYLQEDVLFGKEVMVAEEFHSPWKMPTIYRDKDEKETVTYWLFEESQPEKRPIPTSIPNKKAPNASPFIKPFQKNTSKN